MLYMDIGTIPLTHGPDVAAKGNHENNTMRSYSPMCLDISGGPELLSSWM